VILEEVTIKVWGEFKRHDGKLFFDFVFRLYKNQGFSSLVEKTENNLTLRCSLHITDSHCTLASFHGYFQHTTASISDIFQCTRTHRPAC
jgi:Golgi nucleoside diphosphatase